MADHGQQERPPLAQRCVGLLGALLVLATLGYLGYAALFSDAAPPDVALEVERIEANGDDYLVRFVARNAGAQTAAGVQAEARLWREEQVIEQARVTLDYVPGHSRKAGGFWFSHDPRQGRLQLTVSGYREP